MVYLWVNKLAFIHKPFQMEMSSQTHVQPTFLAYGAHKDKNLVWNPGLQPQNKIVFLLNLPFSGILVGYKFSPPPVPN